MTEDTLARVRAKAADLRDAEQEAADLSERLTAINKKINALVYTDLPQLMHDAGITEVTLAAEGNHAAYKLQLERHYAASIAAKWEPERRKAAFDYLEGEGAGDLIKTEITILLPREDREKAKSLIEQLAEYGPQVKENVHSATLTAWLREQYESGANVDLDTIGGTAAMIVKQRKQRKTERKTI